MSRATAARDMRDADTGHVRDRILAELPDVSHRRFLLYLMGPYEAFSPAELLDADETLEGDDGAETLADENAEASSETDDGAEVPPDETSEASPGIATGTTPAVDAFALLERVRDRLRDEAGLNAFLAVDVGIDLDAVDAATQSVAFARESNVVALVVPRVGKNLGVGIETGAVLEALDGVDQERVVFVHEDGVRSAMIAALSRRWEAAVYSYADEEELLERLREFAVDIMHRELTGDLPRLDPDR